MADIRQYASLHDYCLGFCETCDLPVYIPEFQAGLPESHKGCQCATPDLLTWGQEDRLADEAYAERKREQAERDAQYHVRPSNFSVWKKRAKNL